MEKRLSFLFISIVLFISPLSAVAGQINLPRTGQTTCYDESGNVVPCESTGQDGDIQAGVSWSDPRFVDNGDGTVMDKLTGLTWLKDAGSAGRMSWEEALHFCNTLSSGSYGLTDGSRLGDWRLPNIVELESLVNAEAPNPAAWLNSKGFLNVGSFYYWSSTTIKPLGDLTWNVYMASGHIDGNRKTGENFVWPVRGEYQGPCSTWQTGQKVTYLEGDDGDTRSGARWPSPRFIDNGDGTVTDNLTGLLWLKDANCIGTYYAQFDNDTNYSKAGDGSVTWEHALSFIDQMNSGQLYECAAWYNDWRLPNRKELFSLIDFSEYRPALAVNHPFLNVQLSEYWTATTYKDFPSFAWQIEMTYGSIDSEVSKSFEYYVWPVRGGIIEHHEYFVDQSGSDTSGDGSRWNPWQTIQHGIDYAQDGSTIYIGDGVYRGVGNKNIDFKGKAVILRSEGGAKRCIIDCEGDGRGFYFHSGEPRNAVLSGLTIKNGLTKGERPGGYGGGVYCEGSSPTLENCVIIANLAGEAGGGVYLKDSSAIMKSCVISNNEAHAGGGIECSNCNSVLIRNCLITNNTGYDIGGGIDAYQSFLTILNCTIVNNISSPSDPNLGGGGGIDSGYTTLVVKNSIMRDNTPRNLELGWQDPVTITYSNIGAGYVGQGNIDVDPLFVDPGSGDYHLASASPCIDAGTSEGAPITDLVGNCRYDDPNAKNTGNGSVTYFDMGAYEFFPICDGDIEADLDVDGRDLAVFARKFPQAICTHTDACVTDFDGDDDVDLDDLRVLAHNFGRDDCPSCP